jgi:predicted Zn-dependent protease
MPLDEEEQLHVTAALGWLELGMPLDANSELEKIDPYVRHVPEVLVVRVEIYRRLERWELMATVAKKLSEYEASVPKWTILFAHALRKSGSIERAWEVLLDACTRFPMNAAVRYDLACCECQLGNIEAAKQRLKEAFELDSNLRMGVLSDPDLARVWDEKN